MNRRLAALLVADGIFLAYLTIPAGFLTEAGDTLLANVLLSADALAHLLFIGTLDSPTSRLLRRPWGVAVAVALAFLVAVALPGFGIARGDPIQDETENVLFGAGWPFLACASVFALGVAVDAWLRTPKATPLRRRTGVFALAFGTRDIAVACTIFVWAGIQETQYIWIEDYLPLLLAVGSLLFVVLLAYALLSVQLFDIDLKIKWGAARGVVVVLIVIAALSTAKIVEFYVNRTLGLVFGGVMAGLTLFISPRLNKIADKVANKALPQVQPTSEYLTFKKLEVYRVAVESAIEGGITPKDRGMLDKLQQKLGLSKTDAAALEAEFATATPTPGSA